MTRATSQGEHIPWQDPNIVGFLSLSPRVTAQRRSSGKEGAGEKDAAPWSSSIQVFTVCYASLPLLSSILGHQTLEVSPLERWRAVGIAPAQAEFG